MPKRNDIYESISSDVDRLAKTYGIRVEDVKIKQFDLPESNLNAVYSRMISERNQMAEKYTADGNYEASIIRNDVDKQVNIIVSDARGQSRRSGGGGRRPNICGCWQPPMTAMTKRHSMNLPWRWMH